MLKYKLTFLPFHDDKRLSQFTDNFCKTYLVPSTARIINRHTQIHSYIPIHAYTLQGVIQHRKCQIVSDCSKVQVRISKTKHAH